MNGQQKLYDGNPPSVRGSDTSEAAALSIKPVRQKTQSQVYACILENGWWGRTDDEIELITGMRHQSASARRRELVLSGRIKDSGRRRATRSHRMATVWVQT